jgi:hypothetical protein
VPSADQYTPARRLKGRRAASTWAAALFLGLAVVGPPRSSEAVSRAQLTAIVETLRADPDLKTTRRVKVLRFKQTEPPQQQAPRELPWWLRLMRWSSGALSWLSETARWLVWLLGALAVGLIAISVRRWARERADAGADSLLERPSHVGALDVRPDSLPDRIGAHALMLWQRGEQRAALSMLYRGALSRLIHGYSIPIRTGHTESECIRLAQDRLQQDVGAFFAQLVSVWQLAVYGGRIPEADRVLSLCNQFDLLLVGPAGPKGAH